MIDELRDIKIKYDLVTKDPNLAFKIQHHRQNVIDLTEEDERSALDKQLHTANQILSTVNPHMDLAGQKMELVDMYDQATEMAGANSNKFPDTVEIQPIKDQEGNSNTKE